MNAWQTSVGRTVATLLALGMYALYRWIGWPEDFALVAVIVLWAGR